MKLLMTKVSTILMVDLGTYVVLRFETFYGMSNTNIDLQKCVPEEEVKNRIRQCKYKPQT